MDIRRLILENWNNLSFENIQINNAKKDLSGGKILERKYT
jgi:hypothetical protein